MSTGETNRNIPTGASATGEEGASGTSTRSITNPNTKNQTVATRVRPKRNKGKHDVKKVRGETAKMNGRVFELHAERTNKSQFEDTMEALRIYSSNTYKSDIDSLN